MGVLRIVVLLAQQEDERPPEGGPQLLGVDWRAAQAEGIGDLEVRHRVGPRVRRTAAEKRASGISITMRWTNCAPAEWP